MKFGEEFLVSFHGKRKKEKFSPQIRELQESFYFICYTLYSAQSVCLLTILWILSAFCGKIEQMIKTFTLFR